MDYVQVAILVVVLLLAAFVLHFRAVASNAERRLADRLPVGAGGVIAGADGFELPGSERAVLLLHGFGDTPQTVRLLGAWLQRNGWTVSAPLLPGHGRSLPEFARTGADDWLAAARRHHHDLCARHPRVAVVGLSMGGALATILAATEAHMSALVLLAPYMTMPRMIRRLTRVAGLWGVAMPFVETRAEGSIVDPLARRESLGYGASTPRLLAQLRRVADEAVALAPRVRVPTLMIQSRSDNRIPPEAAQRVFDRFTAPVRQLLWLTESGHVITVDREREHVFAAVSSWLDTHAPNVTGLSAQAD